MVGAEGEERRLGDYDSRSDRGEIADRNAWEVVEFIQWFQLGAPTSAIREHLRTQKSDEEMDEGRGEHRLDGNDCSSSASGSGGVANRNASADRYGAYSTNTIGTSHETCTSRNIFTCRRVRRRGTVR